MDNDDFDLSFDITKDMSFESFLEETPKISSKQNEINSIQLPKSNIKQQQNIQTVSVNRKRLSFSSAFSKTPTTSQEASFFDCPDTPMKNSQFPPPSTRKSNRRLMRESSLGSKKILVNLLDEGKTKANNVFFDNFVGLKTLGNGAFSEVFEVKDKYTNEYYAVKKAKNQFKSKRDRAHYLEELQNVKEIGNNPNIVKYYAAWQENGYFYCQMELCNVGTLRYLLDFSKKHMKIINDELVYHIVYQLINGLEHIHSKNYVHMDIKPENILINSNGVLKIGDFGLCVKVGNNLFSDEGDIVYAAFETLQDTPRMTSADIFSFGLMLLEILTLEKLPRTGDNYQKLRRNIIPFFLRTYSITFETMLLSLLKEIPEDRSTAIEIKQSCMHIVQTPIKTKSLIDFMEINTVT